MEVLDKIEGLDQEKNELLEESALQKTVSTDYQSTGTINKTDDDARAAALTIAVDATDRPGAR